jgi:peptide-methionine (S)-S-oxide reductase
MTQQQTGKKVGGRPGLADRYSAWLLAACSVAVGAMLLFGGAGAAAESAVKIPPPAADLPAGTAATETAVFAGGCFWGVQAVFQHTKGVLQAVSGYAGGEKKWATYDAVSRGGTGHAESVQVTYDPKQVSYGKLLQIYFSVAHDPTQLNRQGPDVGTQYRSAVFYRTPEQQKVAQQYIAQLDAAKVYKAKIATQLTALSGFYAAEDYHQDYATRNPNQPYIAMYDRPKLGFLKELFPEAYRDSPVLVAQAKK